MITTTSTTTATATETVTETAEPQGAPRIEEVSVTSRGKARARKRLVLSAVASHPAGADLTYTWSFSDGKVREGADVVHRFKSKGEYRVVLTVTDGEQTSRVRLLVEVKKAAKKAKKSTGNGKGKKGKRSGSRR